MNRSLPSHPIEAPERIHDSLTAAAQKLPAKTALICQETSWTYRAIDDSSSRLASSLRSLGLEPQDRVAIFLENRAEAVISLYGTLKAEGIAVPINSLVKPSKLKYVLQDCTAKVLITDVTRAATVEAAVRGNEGAAKLIWVGGSAGVGASLEPYSSSWDECTSPASPEHAPDPTVIAGPSCTGDDLALLIYTSGSTGQPKGIMCPHVNVLSAARSIISYLGNDAQDIILNALPLSFDYGLYQVIMAFIFGGTVVLEKTFAFPQKILSSIEQNKVTGLPIVPTMAALLLRIKNLHHFDLSSLRYLTNTGAVLPTAHIARLRAAFPHVRIYSMYGLTECKRVSYLPPEQLDRKPDSVGIPIPGCTAFVVNERAERAAPGEVGELVVQGSNVMRGYWNGPDLTAKVFRHGGRGGERQLYTGDLFRLDEEGYLYYVGRKDDMLKCKGERVSPKEVENVLCGLDGVLQASVIGMPDEILGHALVAFVVPEAAADLTEKAVRRHCHDNLEPFLVPGHIVFVPQIPLTVQGKVCVQSLTRLAEQHLAAVRPASSGRLPPEPN